MRLTAIVTVCLLPLFVSIPRTPAAEPAPEFARLLAFTKQHCVACHGEKEPKADLNLGVFADEKSVVKARKKWLQMAQMVEAGEMPPKEKPERPKPEDAVAFAKDVTAFFEKIDANAKPDPGKVTVRRLNRTEYHNTVRDLLGVDFNPAEDFPSDDIGYGFDNIGDVLTLSPLLMERYLDAAETIAERVILANPPPPSRRYLSGKYLQPNNKDTPQGRFRPLNPVDPEPFNSGPFAAAGDYLKFSADADLILRANLYAETKGTSPVKVVLFLSGPQLSDVSSDAEVDTLMGAALKTMRPLKILQTFEITAREAKQTQQIEVPINRRGDIQRAGIAVVKPPEGEEPPQIFVEHIWTEGPLETRPASQLMILACSPEKPRGDQTREVVTRLLSRGYRRAATLTEVEAMCKRVDQAVADGLKWEAAMQWAVKLMLCSPKFLFRLELDDRPDSPEAHPIGEYELASRLSYFLWSSMPDDELFSLAGQNKLSSPDVLEAQVRRMLKDDRARSLVDGFAMQWLQLKRLKSFAPDATLFPTFNEPLRNAMLRETELFVEAIVKEDRSLLELIDADYTFLNEPLARHYGIVDTLGNAAGKKAEKPGQPIRGDKFQRIALQGHRGGLLTMASILTVTSNPTRTSPVKRGRWVLEQILGTPPPPPPPNVPELNEAKEALTGSLRQRMEQHRANPSCANCHAKMDPLGFAFENFNAIGAFREKDGEFAIDPSGTLPDGRTIGSPAELKTVLKEKRELFLRNVAEKALTYALGRGLDYYDKKALDAITAKLMTDDKFSTLAVAIAMSDPFRLRRGKDQQDE